MLSEIIEAHQVAKRAKTCSDALHAQHAKLEDQLEQIRTEKNKHNEELINMFDKAKSDESLYDIYKASELFENIKKYDEQIDYQWKITQQAHIKFINARAETRRKIAAAMDKANSYLYPVITHKRRVEIKVHMAAHDSRLEPCSQPSPDSQDTGTPHISSSAVIGGLEVARL